MLTRNERERIEVKGVPVVMAILKYLWSVPMEDIEVVTDKERQ